MNIDLTQVWRDKSLLEDIRSEVKRQALLGWRPWQMLLPPGLLWPMIEEISGGMAQEWSPMLDGVGVQLGEEHEVAVRFVLKDMKTSPVMVRSVPYRVESDLTVRHGTPV